MRDVLLTVLLLLLPLALQAEEGDGKFKGLPPCRQDRAFDRFVELTYLGEAWQELSPAKLADCGLQLAEGERVLLRSHRAIEAERVLAYAIELAGSQADGITLGRLARSEAIQKSASLSELLMDARQHLEATELRSAAAPQSQADILYKAVHDDIQEALLTHSAKEAAVLRNLLADLPSLSDSQKRELLKQLTVEVPTTTDEEMFATHSLRYCQLAWQAEQGRDMPHFLRTAQLLRQLTTSGKGSGLQQSQKALDKLLAPCDPADPSCD